MIIFQLNSSKTSFALNDCPQQVCYYLRRDTKKKNNVVVRPAQTQISLDIRQVWSESSLSARR